MTYVRLDWTEPPYWLREGHFPPAFGWFRMEWERAALCHSGDFQAEAREKQRILRWRVCELLGRLTGEPDWWQEAVRRKKELPSSRTNLAKALLQSGKPQQALAQVSETAVIHPLHRAAVRTLYNTLSALGETEQLQSLIHSRRLLRRLMPDHVPQEPWFSRPEETLTSIIVLCCNQLDYSRLCLNSVLRHTHSPYELILVNNGSTDGTASFLESLQTQSGPVRVEVIHNPKNLGFAAGCNQGVACAQGDYLLFLNNDTIVTPGWLTWMLEISRQTDVGLVGAVTNYAPPPQHVPATYSDIRDIDDFAEARRQSHKGQQLDVTRLSGYCLLARKSVLAQIGAWDERFGSGFFEDDDLGLRIHQAGYRLVVALDVYIHHFGSRTFAGLGIDGHQQLRDNFQRFQDKWGTVPERDCQPIKQISPGFSWFSRTPNVGRFYGYITHTGFWLGFVLLGFCIRLGCRRHGKLRSFLSNAIAPKSFLRKVPLAFTASSSAVILGAADADGSGANSSPSGPLYPGRRAADASRFTLNSPHPRSPTSWPKREGSQVTRRPL